MHCILAEFPRQIPAENEIRGYSARQTPKRHYYKSLLKMEILLFKSLGTLANHSFFFVCKPESSSHKLRSLIGQLSSNSFL